MTDKKKLAVIILNWNGHKLLERFLPTVVKNTINTDTDLIVADNGSTDDSIIFVKENFPEIKILEFPENYGFAKGYNLAIDSISHEYVLLLNSDVEVTPEWTKSLIEYLDSNPDVAAVQPKILSYYNKDYFEYAGAAGGLLDRLGYPYCRGRIFSSVEKDLGQYDDSPADICWASGAAMLVRTEIYKQLGGLDPDFFAHMEEIDLCCRMHTAGYKVAVVPTSKVYHVGGASLAQGNPKKTYLNFRNNLLLLHKNLPISTGKRRLFVRRLYDTLAWVVFIIKFDFANASAVFRAHRDFCKMRNNYRNQPDTDVLSHLPGAERDIIIDYYIKRKRK